MDDIPNRWTDSFGLFLPNGFGINNDHETVLPRRDTHLPGHLLLDTFSEDDLHFDTELDLPLDDSRNPLPQRLSKTADDSFGELSDLDLLNLSEMADDLFGELSNSDLLDFLHMQDLSDKESIQEFDATQSRLLSQLADTERPILRESRNIWECVSARNHNLSTPAFHNVGVKIEAKFGFALFPWQASAIVDLTHKKRDVFVIAGTNAGKSLTYQAIPEVTGGIVLVISPTITLMED